MTQLLRPPVLPRTIARICLRGESREVLLGDIDEEFVKFVYPSRGRWLAHRWYWSQVVRAVWTARSAPAVSTTHSTTEKVWLMSTLLQDVRFAVRNLRRSPGFAWMVVFTLALGIGANAAIFTAVNGVLLRTFGFADPDRLVVLGESNVERGWEGVHAAPANVEDWRERVDAFTDVSYLNDSRNYVALTGMGEPVRVNIGRVAGNLFDVLGVPPMLGRTFREEETREDANPVVVLTHASWQNRFGGDAAIVGEAIRLDGRSYEVIGVLPPGVHFEFTDAEMFVTYRWTESRRNSVWFRQAHVVRPVARLRDGVSLEQARQQLSTVARQLQQEHPDLNRGMEAVMTPLREHLMGDTRGPLLLLFSAVGLLQLIACANVANLLLVRAMGRQREIAIRSALGAGKSRIIRQFLTESGLIAIAGAGGGVLLGAILAAWMTTLSPPNLPEWSFTLDGRFLAFTAGVTAISAMLFGVMPAFRSAAMAPGAALGGGNRGGTPGRRGHRTVRLLVGVELAFAFLLVVGAGLMIRTMAQLRQVEAGVNPDGVLTFAVTPPTGTYQTDPKREEFIIDLLERVRALPGVVEVGAVRQLPFGGGGWTSDFTIRGWPEGEFGIEIRHREATPGYFRAMEIPLLAGELFPERLLPETRVPVVVNEAFVERYFPDRSPVGELISFNREPTERSYWYPIVGVVGNERARVTQAIDPEVIAHLRGDTPGTPKFAVKTSVPPMDVVAGVRSTLRALDPDVPLEAVATMATVAAGALARERFLMTLLGVFGALALLLAGVGVYGVAAQGARTRTREIGIRMALGASRNEIIGQLVRRESLNAAFGLFVGLVAALAGARVMQGFLYGVTPIDPITFVAVPGVLATVAVVASWWPAQRATRVDPVAVLKAE